MLGTNSSSITDPSPGSLQYCTPDASNGQHISQADTSGPDSQVADANSANPASIGLSGLYSHFPASPWPFSSNRIVYGSSTMDQGLEYDNPRKRLKVEGKQGICMQPQEMLVPSQRPVSLQNQQMQPLINQQQRPTQTRQHMEQQQPAQLLNQLQPMPSMRPSLDTWIFCRRLMQYMDDQRSRPLVSFICIASFVLLSLV